MNLKSNTKKNPSVWRPQYPYVVVIRLTNGKPASQKAIHPEKLSEANFETTTTNSYTKALF